MQFGDVLKKRKCVRRYTVKDVGWQHVAAILEAATLAPMAGNIFTPCFLIVSDKKKMQQLADAAAQDFLASASWLIVICSDNKRAYNAYGERALRYSRQQVGAAIENMFLKATELNLATCWVGAFDDEAVKNILAIPQDIEVEALLPIAYPTRFISEPRRLKPRLKDVLFFERWGQRIMKPVKRPEPL